MITRVPDCFPIASFCNAIVDVIDPEYIWRVLAIVASFVNGTRGNNLRKGLKYGDRNAIGMNNARRNYGYCRQS